MYTIDAASGCWIWNGHRDSGYGRIGSKLVYRITYERVNGPVPKGLELDHLCRNRACVNPDHLEPVTHSVNSRRGAMARLTESDVRAIRLGIGSSVRRGTLTRLANKYSVGRSTMSRVLKYHTWKEIVPSYQEKADV